MGYAIMRWGKIKFGGVSGAEQHQKTELHKNCEHPELIEKNITLKKFKDETLRQTVKRYMIAQQERTGRRVRKDATVLVDFVLTFSPEQLGTFKMTDWYSANIKWLKEEFGKTNLIRVDVHFHESVPHIHAFVLPLDENGNFNFNKHTSHISQLVKMQDRYAKAMEPFGLQRGKTRWMEYEPGKVVAKNDEVVRHKPLRAYKSELIKEINRLETVLSTLDDKTAEVAKTMQELDELRNQVEGKKDKLSRLRKKIMDARRECESIVNEKHQAESKLKELLTDTESAQKQLNSLQAQADDLRKCIDHYRNNPEDIIFDIDEVRELINRPKDNLDEISEDILGDDDPEH